MTGRVILVVLTAWVGWISGPGKSAKASGASSARARALVASHRLVAGTPLSFEINEGQFAPDVLFHARAGGGDLALTRSAISIGLTPASRTGSSHGAPAGLGAAAEVKLGLIGAEEHVRVVGEDRQPGRANFLIDNDRQHWRTNVATYARVRYEGVYPGIDLELYGTQQQPEYDWIVRPGADPSRIRMAVGGGPWRLDAAGNLVIGAGRTAVRSTKPAIYQEISGVRRAVAGRYRRANGAVHFSVGRYDRRHLLVIDPGLLFASYLGGGENDGNFGTAMTIDSAGAMYVTGSTFSEDFPVVGGLQKQINGKACQNSTGQAVHCYDAFVSKFGPDGKLVYSTYLGGTRDEIGSAIAVDGAGSVYVGGSTDSPDFPTANQPTWLPVCADAQSFDGFVLKLNIAGNSLVFSTCLGGSQEDQVSALAVNATGETFAAGLTASTDFAAQTYTDGCTSGTVQCFNAFVAQIGAAGNSLIHVTLIGGGAEDEATGIALDAAGDPYVEGTTLSSNFPVLRGAAQPTFGGEADAWVAKLHNGQPVYSTYLGGPGTDWGMGIAVDSAGEAYVVGNAGPGFPVANSGTRFAGGTCLTAQGGSVPCFDAFIVKLSADGSSLLFSRYLGGSNFDQATSVAVDGSDVYMAGWTASEDFPVKNAIQSKIGMPGCTVRTILSQCDDAFVARLSSDGSLVWNTYLGGHGLDVAQSVRAAGGTVYVAGYTASVDFPVQDAPQCLPGAEGAYPNDDVFVAKLSASPEVPAATIRVQKAQVWAVRKGKLVRVSSVAPGEKVLIVAFYTARYSRSQSGGLTLSRKNKVVLSAPLQPSYFDTCSATVLYASIVIPKKGNGTLVARMTLKADDAITHTSLKVPVKTKGKK